MSRDISDLMRGFRKPLHLDDDGKPQPLTEAVIMELRERCAQYQQPNTFKVGDLVTPRAGSNMRGQGEPHIVVEVITTPIRHIGDAGSSSYGSLYDTRIMRRDGDGDYMCYFVEHRSLERYVEA